MQKTLCLYKPVGETPLQTITHYRNADTTLTGIKMSPAGRLDPMAEGLLLVLLGDENKKRNSYENLKKTYEFSVLFGIATDSYDLLGIPKLTHNSPLTDIQDTKLKKYLKSLVGTHAQKYPPFSSKPVNGKPLYYWAQRNKLGNIIFPTKEISITAIRTITKRQVHLKNVVSRLKSTLPSLLGSFRQKEILTAWDTLLEKNPDVILSLYDFEMSCSSGTYVRRIADNMGNSLGVGGTAFSIKRTRVGEYTLQDIPS
ncbi:MAG: tRNA pseudouridine synthase tRNA pseudouridine55 synthase [Candidatus Parcubacteria bacterium]